MKVSSKINSGFLILMALALVVLLNQYRVIHQLQAVNSDLSELSLNSATTVLRIDKIEDVLFDDSKKYLGGLGPSYAQSAIDGRQDFLDRLNELRKTVRSDAERAATGHLATALDDYWAAFNRLKEQNKDWDPHDLPSDFTNAMDHLQAETEVAHDAVQISMKQQVAAAANVRQDAKRVLWAGGVVALLLGVIVATGIVRSINEPLRRLTQGTRAIAKGQFWHRIPAQGKDEFAELAKDFNIMSERLGELDRMKKDFVSHVSHDLKAPLASIRQIMHLLLQEIPGQLNEQQKGLIQLSYNSAERLAAMVGNLLDVSRMEAGSMEYDIAAHDIVPLIKGVTAEFDVQAQEKGIRLRLECEQPVVFVQCDRDRIVQVIGNLFENALKFSPGNSEIVTRVAQGRGQEIVISVADSGPGVPEGHKEKIFQKFHQVKYGKKVAGQGVGLGLAICRTIVEAHHGDIWVEDNANGGSVFCFVLQPAAKEEILKCGQSQTA
jgi:signal transduction histidine kinase